MSAEMAEPNERDARHVALETKVMFLENALESISEVVLEQGRQLDSLARRVDALLGDTLMRDAGERAEGPREERTLADDVPPHY